MSFPQASSPIERRAFSHGNCIRSLFERIIAERQSADRTLANYFREHKKHGAKDRRLIRETLFSLFRWWGWLDALPLENEQKWYAQLALAAAIEGHPWQDISMIWAAQAKLPSSPVPAFGKQPDSLVQLSHALSKLFAGHAFVLDKLLPDWIWPMLTLPEGEKTAFIDALCRRPPLWTRVQGSSRTEVQALLAECGVESKSCDLFEDTLQLPSQSLNLDAIVPYRNGKLEIQDLASQAIGQVCAPGQHEHWWDACAGAGGKSLQLFALMQRQGGVGRLVASDVRAKALDELLKRAHRAQFSSIEICPWRGDTLPVAADAFDGVLVDAPCSCTGTWRRNPDMRWLDAPTAVTDKPALQLDILRRASAAVRRGGVLVYATCSLARAENEAVIASFLALQPEFSPEIFPHPFGGTAAAAVTLWPQQANADGMFVARLRRSS